MKKLASYEIVFSSLKQGEHSFEFLIDQSFFDLFSFEQEFESPNITVAIIINKHSSFLELEIRSKGSVGLICDISGETFNEKIANTLKTLVKFGDEFNDTNDEVLILPQGAYSVNVAQLIFESILLAIPMKHIHPKYKDGLIDEHIKLLEKYHLPEISENEEDE